MQGRCANGLAYQSFAHDRVVGDGNAGCSRLSGTGAQPERSLPVYGGSRVLTTRSAAARTSCRIARLPCDRAPDPDPGTGRAHQRTAGLCRCASGLRLGCPDLSGSARSRRTPVGGHRCAPGRARRTMPQRRDLRPTLRVSACQRDLKGGIASRRFRLFFARHGYALANASWAQRDEAAVSTAAGETFIRNRHLRC